MTNGQALTYSKFMLMCVTITNKVVKFCCFAFVDNYVVDDLQIDRTALYDIKYNSSKLLLYGELVAKTLSSN